MRNMPTERLAVVNTWSAEAVIGTIAMPLTQPQNNSSGIDVGHLIDVRVTHMGEVFEYLYTTPSFKS
jgi:hypothetical protein